MYIITQEEHFKTTGQMLPAKYAIFEDEAMLILYDTNEDGQARVIPGGTVEVPKIWYTSIYEMCDDLFDALSEDNNA